MHRNCGRCTLRALIPSGACEVGSPCRSWRDDLPVQIISPTDNWMPLAVFSLEVRRLGAEWGARRHYDMIEMSGCEISLHLALAMAISGSELAIQHF